MSYSISSVTLLRCIICYSCQTSERVARLHNTIIYKKMGQRRKRCIGFLGVMRKSNPLFLVTQITNKPPLLFPQETGVVDNFKLTRNGPTEVN